MAKLAYYPLYLATAAFLTLIATQRHSAPPQHIWLDLLSGAVAGKVSTAGPCATLDACTSELAECLHEENATVAATVESFVNQQPARVRVELALFSRKRPVGGLTVTTQSSSNRALLIEDMCRYWVGPLAAAVYLPIMVGRDDPADPHLSLSKFKNTIWDLFSRTEEASEGCQLDIVLVSELVANEEMFGLVPVNVGRNLATLLARTELVMQVDIDFLISRELSDIVRDPVRYDEVLRMARNRTAIVLPAFTSDETAVPIDAVAGGKCAAVELFHEGRFRMFNNGTNDPTWTQAPTDHHRWLTADAPYAIEYHSGFEPWVIVTRKDTPMYDVRYRGRGINKIVYLKALDYAGFGFAVLDSAFIVHRPHGSSGLSVETMLKMRPTWANNTHWYYHGDLRDMHPERRTYSVVVSEAFDACRARLPWWQIYSQNGSLVKTRHIPFQADSGTSAAAA